jgi:hypothetical protein
MCTADDEQLAVLRVLADRRRSLGEDHTRMISQLHQLLLELIPGGAKKDLSRFARPFPRPRTLPDHSRCQAPSCLTAARTGTPFQWRKRSLTQMGAMTGARGQADPPDPRA